ncbi:MAG: RsmB/NOP family class I SAM-dependent RNA methyltransferase [Eubacteriales bacterium]|nr:RsmB/NOP family class I SAM-dependent RNA methyltransferase [Eubacteriales bacterium]
MAEITLPRDFAERMKSMLGAEYDAFESAFTADTNIGGMRINTLKKDAETAVLDKTGELEAVKWCKEGYYSDKEILNGKHPYHSAGLIYFQEPSAMAAVPVLRIEKGSKVLDLCAAPGGKSTQAAAFLAGTGLLVANEIIPSRAKILSENIERMGIKNAVVINESPEKLLQKYTEEFDYIILDAPCSGEGMFRKEPQAVTEWSLAHSEACAVRQKHIVDCAVGMLKNGGRLVYSTCTFAPCENEEMAEYITATYPEMKLVNAEIAGTSDGYDSNGFTKRIFPHKAKGEGHFVALFEKSGDRINTTKIAKNNKKPSEYEEFCKKYLKNVPEGEILKFGDRLYLMPVEFDIDKIKVLRAGLELGEVRKGRFIPSHALALALKKEDFAFVAEYDVESEEIKRYMHGETLNANIDGWCAVLVEGYPLGWAKGSGGVLKNHYPKHLRS